MKASSRPSGLLVAMVLLATPPGPTRAAPGTPPYQDNPRPVELRITPELRFSRILVLLGEPRGARIELEPGPGRHPTLRAREAGTALPGPASIGGHLARFGLDSRARSQLFWSGADRYHGQVRWSTAAPRETLLALARRIDQLMGADTATAWLDHARSLPPGSRIDIQLAASLVTLRLFGGPQGTREARRAFDAGLSGRQDWQALTGLHSPAFRAGDSGPAAALLLAGPIVIEAAGADPEAALRAAAALLRRPLPPAPKVPDLAPRPPERRR